jgi:hypothetical protein
MNYMGAKGVQMAGKSLTLRCKLGTMQPCNRLTL